MVTPRLAACEADVCIVGGGPVGLTLATTLVARGLSVVVLESGGNSAPFDDAAFDQALDGAVDAPGWAPLWTSRSRGLGGTSRIWNTVVGDARVAKYARMAPLDFETRPGVAHSGWPLTSADLTPFLERASTTCGLATGIWQHATSPVGPVGTLEPGLYGFGPRSCFTHDLVGLLEAHPRGTVFRGATATGFEVTDGGRRIDAVHWACDPSIGASGGASAGRVVAAKVVLAAGALENARLLLTEGREQDTPWSESFWLGRGLMEHPIDRSLDLVTRSPRLCPDPGFFGPHIHPTAEDDGWNWSMGRLEIPAEHIREAQLPSASLRFTTQETSPAVLEAPAARSWARRLIPGTHMRRRVGDLVRGSARQVRRFRGLRYTLRIDLEQWPDPENRVVLSHEVDALGRPRLGVQWRWSAEDERRRRRLVDVFAAGLEQARLGRLERNTEHALNPNAHHHAGTTRMGASPADSVVDAQLRVHGTDNLFVCGSSVFPTAGSLNPTLTAVALAHRLADHVQPPTVPPTHPQAPDLAD